MSTITALLAIGAAEPTASPPPRSLVFACSFGSKQVSVRAVGRDLIYRFGTRTRTELSITGSAARGNVFYWSGRYAGIANQLRFINGRYSYTVYSLARTRWQTPAASPAWLSEIVAGPYPT